MRLAHAENHSIVSLYENPADALRRWQMTRNRGNPGWSSGRPAKVHASAPTEFEMQAQRLGLNEENYESSDHLRRWCEDNRHRFYVPEWLLKRWHMFVDPNAA